GRQGQPMTDSLSALLYLVASVCFIMALRGLSSPDTARAGNIYGIAGMAIAILTTLVTPQIVSYWLIIVGLLIGGAIGTYIAREIQMTALPQLVAAFHSLVGLAAVCVASAAFAAPEDYGIGIRGAIHGSSLVEMAIGLTIGAITFTGLVRLRHRVHPVEQPPDHHRRAGRFLGRDPQLHHVQGDEPLDRQCDPRRFRHRERRRADRNGGRRPARQIRQRRGCRLHPQER